MSQSQTKRSRLMTLVLTGIPAILWLAPPVVFIAIVPPMKRTIIEFGMKLPVLTQWVFDIGSFFLKYIFIGAPLWGISGLALLALGQYLRRDSVPRGLFAIWFLAISLVLLLVNAMIGFGLWLPWIKLAEGLNK